MTFLETVLQVEHMMTQSAFWCQRNFPEFELEHFNTIMAHMTHPVFISMCTLFSLTEHPYTNCPSQIVFVFPFCYVQQALMANVFQFCFIVVPMMFSLSMFNVITDSVLTKSVPSTDTGMGVCNPQPWHSSTLNQSAFSYKSLVILQYSC